jgi:hypothetical protein
MIPSVGRPGGPGSRTVSVRVAQQYLEKFVFVHVFRTLEGDAKVSRLLHFINDVKYHII